MLHIPLLRRGRPYKSVEVAPIVDFKTREAFAEISQANPGLVRRDLRDEEQRAMRGTLERFRIEELVTLSGTAGNLLVNDSLPLGDGLQTPQDYVRQTSATTGLPHVMVRKNLEKIRAVLADMRTMLDGLTRNLDLSILDSGVGEAAGHALSFLPRTSALGVVLPSNSPGVHALWVPTIALKTALVLKPGGAEPWTPYRLIQAFVRAGVPPEAFGYYPTDHAGAAEVLSRCGRGIVFGDTGSTSRWLSDPRVEVHGPGYSKVVLGPDVAGQWERYLDVMVASILENSGRSCVNASGVWVTAHGREIAEALAERLAGVRPRAAEDETAQLAPFADPRVAERISAIVDQGLSEPGARDVTASRREGGRVMRWEGATYLLPTIVHCDSPRHPLANREFLFPFASVVEVHPDDLPECLGPSLAVTLITSDQSLVRRLLASPLVHRLSLGPIPTQRVSWDQPHEGNLFEHLYARRAFQRAV
jgi:Aldehyde dehydrogenase family